MSVVLLFTEKPSPELGRVSLGDAKGVSLKLAFGKDGFNLGQHVAEDERQLGEVSSRGQGGENRERVATRSVHRFASTQYSTHIQTITHAHGQTDGGGGTRNRAACRVK